MDKMLDAEKKTGSAKKEKIDYKAEIAKMFAHMDIVSERIKHNLMETDQLQAETRAILTEIKAS